MRRNLINTGKGQMGNKRGNPAFVKGKSANPEGRPRGQTSFAVFCQDPHTFLCKHMRWVIFCWALKAPPYTGAAAARKAGYSPRSARFIASRLLKNDIIRATLNRIVELTCHPDDRWRARRYYTAVKWQDGKLT